MPVEKTTFDVFGNSLVVEQRRDDARTVLQVRRVKTDDRGEHVQVEVKVEKIGKNRNTVGYGFLALSPEAASTLVVALLKLHPPHDPADKFKPASEAQNDWRSFYGLLIERRTVR